MIINSPFRNPALVLNRYQLNISQNYTPQEIVKIGIITLIQIQHFRFLKFLKLYYAFFKLIIREI